MNNKLHPSSDRPLEIELIRQMAHKPLSTNESKKLDELLLPPPDAKDAFIIKSAGDWMQTAKREPHQGMLFGNFWFEGELCFLFADTNVGKSVLAVQIADSLSRGESIPGFDGPSEPQTVLYFDFELSARQFEKRYSSDNHGKYGFSPNFYHLVFNPDAIGAHRFSSYADYINNALENILITSGARIIIIDNITCLRTSTEASAGAIRLMRNLQAIKNRYGLSVLVLAHTPKRNPVKPVTRNDLQGSKMLINFADSAFAIGESQTAESGRYLKQIKQRSIDEVYGAQNVCLGHIVKHSNFLSFQFTGFGAEANHLQHYTEQHRKNTETRILKLHHQGLSLRQIVADTGISYSTVQRLLKRLSKEEDGEVNSQK